MEGKEAPKASDGPRRKNHRWDADNATPDGLTSMDVLLTWMSTPGNLARWRAQYHKADLCGEMVTALREEGIKHREIKDVRFKVWTLEKQFASAEKFLASEGQREAFLRGMAKPEVEEQMQFICPLFRELLPSMEAANNVQVIDKSTQPGSLNGGASADGSSSEAAIREQQPTPNPVSSLTKRRKAISEAPLILEPKRRAPRQQKQRSNDAMTSESGVLTALSEEERVQRKELFELKRTLLLNEIKAKEAQQAVQLKCETMLARKKLLDADVAQAEVDSAFPL